MTGIFLALMARWLHAVEPKPPRQAPASFNRHLARMPKKPLGVNHRLVVALSKAMRTWFAE
jgi:hypothetical protein